MANQNLLDESLIQQVKGIQIRAKHLVNTSLAGDYVSAFKGRGMEFDEVREYTPGDDVRSIDWNVTARSNHPYVKVFRDERELTVMFMVDVSASNHFGTTYKFKHEIAAEISALLAYTALRNNDKVGLLIFSDEIEHYIPPKKGRGHIWRIIKEILTYKSKAKKTNLTVPLEFLGKVQKHRSIVFMISDFQERGHENLMRVAARNHDLIAVSLHDPREKELPSIGYIELEDAETGEFVLVNTGSKKIRRDFEIHSKRERKELKNFFLSSGIDHIEIESGQDYIHPIVQFFRQREKRR